MEFIAKTIAKYLHGEIEGNSEMVVNSISGIEEGKQGTLSFLANPKYEKYIYTTDSSIVLVRKDFVPERKVETTLIRVDNPYEAFALLLDLYDKSRPEKVGISDQTSIHKTVRLGKKIYVGEFTCISENARIGNKVKIYPQVFIGANVEVKKDTIIYPGVKIYHDTQIGSNCVIHAGVVIGADGFGFAQQLDNYYKKVPQLGNVLIGNNVEIGANVTIDRATMGSTIIHDGVKLDNLIQVGHNVEIGENTVIVSQTGIAGSSKIGKNCMLGGQVGIVGHINIADEVKIGGQSGVTHDIKKKGEIILGGPAKNINQERRSIAVYRRLPELQKLVYKLQKEIEELKNKK